MEKIVVFDLGGTLMEYAGMPLSWLAYYPQGFAAVNQALSLGLTQEEIDRSVQVLKRYNPRYFPREEEIRPEKIFGDAIRDELAARHVVMKDTPSGVEWSVTGLD